jgi:hypothetical protein
VDKDNKPIIALDVDGVLNPDVSSRQRSRLWYHHGWRRKSVQLGAGGGPTQLIVNPETGIWLQKLARDTGAELVWATRWNDLANAYVRPLANLPTLPYIATPSYLRPDPLAPNKATNQLKAPFIVKWSAGRPLLWLDDEPPEIHAAERLVAPEQLFRGILTDPKVGLTIEHIDEARAWLAGLV